MQGINSLFSSAEPLLHSDNSNKSNPGCPSDIQLNTMSKEPKNLEQIEVISTNDFQYKKLYKFCHLKQYVFAPNYKPTEKDLELINGAIRMKEYQSKATDSTTDSLFATPIRFVPQIRIQSSFVPHNSLNQLLMINKCHSMDNQMIQNQGAQQQKFGQQLIEKR